MTSQASSSVAVIAFPQLVARNWWLFFLRGLAAITFGVAVAAMARHQPCDAYFAFRGLCPG